MFKHIRVFKTVIFAGAALAASAVSQLEAYDLNDHGRQGFELLANDGGHDLRRAASLKGALSV